MTRRIAATVTAVVLLAGCGTTTTTNPDGSTGEAGDVRVIQPQLPNGKRVTCVIWDGYKQGGLSCDWGAVK